MKNKKLANAGSKSNQASCTFPNIFKKDWINFQWTTNLPEGMCIMEMILPPIQGTTLRSHSLLFSSMGVLENCIPLGPETSSTSGIWIAFSAKHLAKSIKLCYRIGIFKIRMHIRYNSEVKCNIICRILSVLRLNSSHGGGATTKTHAIKS